jgi:nicotinamide phosphoribosyltransferase
MKATYVEINGIGKNIFKDPVTDNGLKKSAKGLLRVTKSNGIYILHDEQTESQENDESNELKQVYINGKFTKRTTLSEIRERINTNFS